VANDPLAYQAFINASKAEFGIAKPGYVVTRSGWFSGRSAVYLLAAARSWHRIPASPIGYHAVLGCSRSVRQTPLSRQSPKSMLVMRYTARPLARPSTSRRSLNAQKEY
jgi:hypothetical protein